jgi:hypothetical protein
MKMVSGKDIMQLGEAMERLRSLADPEMVALRTDAARYRWLREQAGDVFICERQTGVFTRVTMEHLCAWLFFGWRWCRASQW